MFHQSEPSSSSVMSHEEKMRRKIAGMLEIFPHLSEAQIQLFVHLNEEEMYEKLFSLPEKSDESKMMEAIVNFDQSSTSGLNCNGNQNGDHQIKNEQIAEALWAELVKRENCVTDVKIRESTENVGKLSIFLRDYFPKLRMNVIYELAQTRDFLASLLILGLCNLGLEDRLRKYHLLPKSIPSNQIYNEANVRSQRELEAKNGCRIEELPKFAINEWKHFQSIIKDTVSSYEKAICIKCSSCNKILETKNAIWCNSQRSLDEKYESHSFCGKCVQKHAITERAHVGTMGLGVKCLQGECGGVIFEAYVTPILTEEQRDIFTQKLQKVALDEANLENLEKCQRCTFALVIEIAKEVHSVFRCENPKCQFKFCRLCEKEYNERHDGKQCDQVMNADTAHVFNFLFFHANASARRNLICKPDPLADRAFGFRTAGNLAQALTGYCTRCAFSTWATFENFRADPYTQHKANLLLWLSNRLPVMCRLPPRFRVKCVQTEHQYVLPPVPTDKESRFQKCLKNSGGASFFAFHGSPVENWYKILSEGLLVASGTQLQLFGQAHGRGVYLGKDPLTSQTYSTQAYMTQRFNVTQAYDMVSSCGDPQHVQKNRHLNNGTWCLALVEVVDDKSRYEDHGWCFVVKDADIIQIRILFIHDAASQPVPRVNLRHFAAGHPDMMRVRQAMDFFVNGDYRERLAAVSNS